jgi:hypothetical protein
LNIPMFVCVIMCVWVFLCVSKTERENKNPLIPSSEHFSHLR